MSGEKKGYEPQGKGLGGWIREMRQRLSGAMDGDDVIPETIEQAHLEAAEESITTVHQLLDYMQSQLTESGIIKESGARVAGGSYLEFPEQGVVLSLGLPDHNFYFMYGLRAENRGKTLDPKKYIDMIVEDLERKVAQGQVPDMSYELYPLREAIEFTLIEQHGFKRGAELNQRAMELEKQAEDQLSRLADPMEVDSIEVDGITISRKTNYGKIRVFDVECYK